MSTERINYLVRNYAANSATGEEVEELFAWLRQHSEDEALHTELEKMAATTVPDKKYDPAYWESFIQQVLQTKKQQPVAHSIRMLRRRWLQYAAAVLVLIGIAVLAVVVSSDRQHKTPGTDMTKSGINDILPGSEKAILTLANGKTIILDSAQGNIVQQGGLTVINRNGKLEYEGSNDVMEYHTMSTPRGGQYKLRLPDGTHVWLNAASSIAYPTAFTGNQRKVTITGEAYFEVVKDKTKPFHVKVNDMEVEVLGTHFNINAYSDEAAIKTTLLEGSVKVSNSVSASGGRSVTLVPEQQAVQYGNVAGITVIENSDLAQVMAWKNGVFNFNKLSLQEVLRQLSRWYDVDVVYQGNVSPKKFGGEIGRDLNLLEVLNGLKDTGVHFNIEGKKLIVMP